MCLCEIHASHVKCFCPSKHQVSCVIGTYCMVCHPCSAFCGCAHSPKAAAVPQHLQICVQLHIYTERWRHHLNSVASLYAAVPPFITCSTAWWFEVLLSCTIAMLPQICLQSLNHLPCQKQGQESPLMCTSSSSSSNCRTKLSL